MTFPTRFIPAWVVGTLLLFASAATAAKPKPTALFTPRFTVELKLQVSNISEDSVTSEFTNALKKLKDVAVVNDGGGMWVFYINISPIMDQRGLKGYSMSVVIADRYATRTLKNLPLEDFKTPAVEKTVKELAQDLADVREQLMVTTTVADFPRACSHVVDHFDETYLMPTREEMDDYNYDKAKSLR